MSLRGEVKARVVELPSLSLCEWMDKQERKRINVVGFLLTSIGLAADVVGLSSLTKISKVDQGNEFFLWAFFFLSIIYSIALISFFTRKTLYEKARDKIKGLRKIVEKEQPSRKTRMTPSPSEVRNRYSVSAVELEEILSKIDYATFSMTVLVGIPIIICFACALGYAYVSRGRGVAPTRAKSSHMLKAL